MTELTDDQVEQFVSLLYPIPVSKGLMREWRETNVPGVSTRMLVDHLLGIGRIERSSGGQFTIVDG